MSSSSETASVRQLLSEDSSMNEFTRVNRLEDTALKHLSAETADIDVAKANQIKENLRRYEQLFGADEDAFKQPTTTRKELWSYYLYYNVRWSNQLARPLLTNTGR